MRPAPSSTNGLSKIGQSPWHSPVPYLFGGLAAMLVLIAFALLTLACSYWKLSSNYNAEEENQSNRDEKNGAPPVFEEKIFVIMAGDCKPTYLATPIFSRAFSLGSNSEKIESVEKPEQGESRARSHIGENPPQDEQV